MNRILKIIHKIADKMNIQNLHNLLFYILNDLSFLTENKCLNLESMSFNWGVRFHTTKFILLPLLSSTY